MKQHSSPKRLKHGMYVQLSNGLEEWAKQQNH
jgi:hypothetical protein